MDVVSVGIRGGAKEAPRDERQLEQQVMPGQDRYTYVWKREKENYQVWLGPGLM
jgi:hypothetical protein